MNPKLPIEFLKYLEDPLEGITAYLLLRNDNLETMTAAIEIARVAYSEEFSSDIISLLACAAVPDPITPESTTNIAVVTAVRSAFDEARLKLLLDLKEGGYEYIDPIPATV
jgi:hypothetical protein